MFTVHYYDAEKSANSVLRFNETANIPHLVESLEKNDCVVYSVTQTDNGVEKIVYQSNAVESDLMDMGELYV
jgi:hypothetical protein